MRLEPGQGMPNTPDGPGTGTRNLRPTAVSPTSYQWLTNVLPTGGLPLHAALVLALLETPGPTATSVFIAG